jgi:nucleoside-diphosphate-sugar epimerase/predicted dehydrogenase
VGAGYVSPYHIRAVQSTGFAEVVGIADPNLARAKELADKYGIPGVYETLAATAASKPEVIHILTPPASHCALTLEALDMGCHVFVEKPMAETAADCDRMIARAKEKGLHLSVNHSARMDPIVLRGLDIVRHGGIGEVTGADFFRSSDYPAWAGGPMLHPYRNGSYPFQDLGVHALYLLEAFLGELQSVSVDYWSTGKNALLCFDEWRATVKSDRKAGHLYLSWNVRPMQNELTVHGTSGVVHIDCFLQTCTVRRTYPAPKPIQRILGAMFNSLSLMKQVTMNTLRFVLGKLVPSPGIHTSVIRFHEALHAGAAPPIPPDEGRRMVVWMEDVSERADESKRQLMQERPSAQPARILVTGASGFLGSTLLRKLRAQGDIVRVLMRRPSAKMQADPDVHIVYGDLGEAEVVDHAVAGIDTVYHVGAAMNGWREDFERGTVIGTRNVVDACLRHGVKRLVYVSSLSVVDHAGHRRPQTVRESAAFEPFPDRRGDYTRVKLEAERIVANAVRERQLPAVILRPGQIFGPGAEKSGASGTFRLAGRQIVYGSGSLPLPLVYVDDVADALILAAALPKATGQVFHIVDPEVVTQRTFLKMQSKWWRCNMGGPLKVAYWPKWLLIFLAAGVETLGAVLRRGVPLTRYRVRSLPPLYPFDLSAATNELGWKPRVGAIEGLRKTFGG